LTNFYRIFGTEGRYYNAGFSVSKFYFTDEPGIANNQNAKDASTISVFVRLSF